MLIRVEAPHFVAGVIFDGPTATTAAPILYWIVKQQKTLEWCINYWNKKGFKFDVYP
jgi:hypothetical protein